MTITILPVDVSHVHQTWPLVQGFIEESVGRGMPKGTPNYSSDHILHYVSSGQWMLLVAADENNTVHGAMTISFMNYPLHRIAFITATGGKGIINKDSFRQLEAIAKHHGATKIQAMARKSMAKLLETCDMVPGNTLMEYKIS